MSFIPNHILEELQKILKPFSFAERDEKKARERARKIREQRDEQDKIVLMASGTFKATELDKSILETSFDPETEEMERKKRIRERSEKLMRFVMKFLCNTLIEYLGAPLQVDWKEFCVFKVQRSHLHPENH